MPKYSNTIEYNITTKLDSKGLTQLQSQIKDVEVSLKRLSGNDLNDTLNFNEPIRQLQELNKALSSSFNSSLGMLDLTKFKSQIQAAGITAKDLGVAFKNSGAQGQVAMNNLLGQIGKIDTGLKRSSTTVDKIFNTIQNTVRWGVVSSGFSAMLNSLHQSVDYVKELDNSMTQIMLVTDYSRQQMNEYAKSANEAAKALGNTTVGVMQGTQIFAQQGYNLEQSGQLAGLSIKLANASEQDAATTSDQITALMNAYNLDGNIESLSKALDSWALVANVSAADVEELAKASQKAASSASTVGVSIDQMNAQIATIESVTRDAPEQIGNGLKTLYARFSDIGLGETLEDGVNLGKVTGVLNKIGVEVLDQAGQMRNVGDIMEDLMGVWDNLDQTSKKAAGQAIAGKYQLNRFYALMDNSDMYKEYKAGSENAEGTLDQMTAEYLDSMEGRAAKLQATLEGLFNSVFNPDNFYPAIDALTGFIDLIKKLVDSIGGGETVLTGAIALFGKLFSNNMAQMINDRNINAKITQARKENSLNVEQTLQSLGFTDPETFQNQNSKEVVDFIIKGQEQLPNMSESQMEQYNRILTDIVNSEIAVATEAEKMQAAIKAAGIIGGAAQDKSLGSDINGLLELLNEFDKGANLKQYSESFENGAKAVKEYKTAIENALQIYHQLQDNTKNAEVDMKKFENSMNLVKDALGDFHSTGVLQNEEYETMKNNIDDIIIGIKDWDSAAENAEDTLRNLGSKAKDFIDTLRELLTGQLNPDQLRKYLETAPTVVETRKAEGDRAKAEGKAFHQGVQDQNSIQSIIEVTSAIGQLSFAWQSFQNLGSLWVNEDLNTGEKILQTITNLSFMLPSLINGIKTLKTASKDIDWANIFQINIPTDKIAFGQGANNIINQKQELEKQLFIKQKQQQAARKGMASTAQNYGTDSRYFKQQSSTYYNRSQDIANIKQQMSDLDLRFGKAAENVTKGFDTLTTKQKLFVTASKAANKATSLLGSAIEGLTSPIAMAGMAIIGLIANIAQMKAQVEQTNINRLFEDYQKVAENRNVDLSQFDNLYKDYQKTGVASDELINVSKTLGEQLNIVGDQALINAGNFDELSKQIHKAAKESDQMAKEAADKTVNAMTSAEKQHHVFTDDFANKFNFLPGSGDTISTRTGISYGWLGQDQSNMDALEKYQAITKALGEANKNLDDYNAKLDEAKDKGLKGHQLDVLTDQIKHEEEIRNGLSEALATEDMEKVKTIIDVESKALEESLPEKAKNFSNKSLQEVIDTLKDSEGEFKYLAEKIKAVTGESGEEAGKEFLLRLIQSLSGGKADAADILSDFGKIDPDKINAKDTRKKITNLNLSDEDFKALGFDSAEAFWEAFEQALKDKTFTFDPKQFKYDEDKIAEIFKKAKMEDVPVDRYVQQFKESGGAGISDENLNTLREEVDHLTESYNKASEEVEKYSDDINSVEYKNAAEEARTLNDALNTASENLKQMAVEALETANGMDELSEKWKDINDAIQNGSPGELASAYSELQNILAQILNVDPSTITQSFMESADVLQALGELANGDTDAIFRLREAFADPLNIQAYLDTTSLTNEEIPLLMAMISEASANLPDLEVGARLEGTPEFQNALAELCASSQEAASIIAQTFEGLGYDVQVDYSSTLDFTNVKAQVDEVMAGSTMRTARERSMQETTTAITFLTEKGPTISVPKFTFTKKGGNSGGSTYRGNTGGGGRSGGGGSCFVAGTLVTMQGYYQEIEKVNKGDIVLSYNETTKTNEYSQVIQTMIHATTEKIYTLYIKDEQLRVTGIHRFFVKQNNKIDWIEAENLQEGDLVFFANGTWHKILKISINIETRYVYNFEVSNNHNYYVGINRILAHNKGGGSGGKGGGGGGGSGKTYEPKKKDPIEEEIDLYEKVNTQLDDVEETLKGIEQETDRLIGTQGRANMNKQITLLEKEIKLQKEKLAIQEKERNDLRNQLTQRFGVTYDSEGFIDNYAATLKKLEGQYNNLINQYNATTTEAGQEALEKQIEKAKENIDDFKDLYKRYDELQGKEIKDTINQLEELEDQIEDLRIEAYKASQEAIDELKELRDKGAELLGLFTKYKSDSPFRATIVDAGKLKNIFGGTKKEAAAYYDTLIKKNQDLAKTATDEATRNAALSSAKFFQEQKQSAMNNPLGSGALGLASADLARLQKWWENPGAEDNPFGEDTAALYEAYQDAYDRMSDLALEAEQTWEDLQESIIDGYDEMADREQEQIERYDRLTDRLETIADTHALVYGDDAYENISKIYRQIGDSNLQQLRDQKTIYENWVQRYNAIENKESEYAKEVLKHLQEAEDQLYEMQENVIEAWQKSFENALKEITAKTNKSLFGQRNLDDTESDWERDRDYAERYYDDVQKAARVDQLRVKYLDLLDDAQTSSLAIQNKIRDAMNEQVSYLQNQKNLSEYNVKYANAQLEILQKQLALEDARNNKNQMRLRRDTQGNYRYVYTANQDDIRGKEQDLLQSQMDAYDMSKQNRMDMTQEAFNLYRTTMEQLEALNQRIREGDEEAVRAKEQLLEDFERDMRAYSEEIGESWNGMVESIKWMAETGTDAVKDSVQGALEAIQTNNDTVLEDMGIKGNEFIGEALSNIDNVVNRVIDAGSQMTNQAESYRKLIKEEVAPIVQNGFSNIDGAIIAAKESTKGLAAATNELNTALMGDNAQLVEATQKLEDYRKQLEGVKEASAVTAQQLRNTQAALDQAKSENLNYRTILEDIASGRRDIYGNLPMQASGGGDGDLKGYNLGTLVEGIAGDIWINGEWGNNPTRHALLKQKFGSRGDEMYNHIQWRFNTGYGYSYPPEHGFDRAYYHKFDPDKFDTGGYTGAWGNNGKLAMLHEKELVLNSSDTENILNAVNMVRQMADTLKTLSGLSVKGTGFNKLGGDTIKQRVEITAEFPNVQSSNEIENALLSLADSAYQYSYRTV